MSTTLDDTLVAARQDRSPDPSSARRTLDTSRPRAVRNGLIDRKLR